MFLKRAALPKCFVAFGTTVRLLARVDEPVGVQIALTVEALQAELALEGFFGQVDFLVGAKVGEAAKGFGTGGTGMLLLLLLLYSCLIHLKPFLFILLEHNIHNYLQHFNEHLLRIICCVAALARFVSPAFGSRYIGGSG